MTDPFRQLPPSSIESEMCLLASMMLDKDMLKSCRRLVRRDDFYQEDHRIIFDAIVAIDSSNRPVDAVILREYLLNSKRLDEVGGASYLGTILSSVPSPAHGEHYAGIVRATADRRRLIKVGSEVVRRAFATDLAFTPNEIRKYAVEALAENALHERSALHISEVLARSYEGLEPGKDTRLKSCLYKLNALLGGYRLGGNHVIGAVNSTGKSVLATQEIVHWAISDIPVLHFSLEEPVEMIGEKMFARHGDVSATRIGSRQMTKEDWASTADVLGKLSNKPYWLVGDVYNIDEIEDVAAQHIAKHEIKVVCVDHLHLVDGGRGETEENRLSDVSKRLKRLYHLLGVVGMTVAQINRNSTYQNRMPRKSDLRGSGGIDNDADAVILIHREDILHHGDRNYTMKNDAQIIVDKNKGGKTGFDTFAWDGDHQRFLDDKNPFDDENIPTWYPNENSN